MSIQLKSRYLISIFILLMASAIVVLDISLLQEQEGAVVDSEVYTAVQPLPSEAGVFKRDEFALDYQNMPDNPQHRRSLKTYYKNRAYFGAPPVIPHVVLNEKTMGDKSCLQCHQNGGFVAQFNAFAPVTPHPELINCKQCHVSTKTRSFFRESLFAKLKNPEVGVQALIGSPPVIPHSLQMRENCLACHGGPAAPKEIRVNHPERVNCRQCHAVKPVLNIEWVRTSYK